MTSLIGLAFTSPQLAVMVCDREKFRVLFYQNRPSDLHAFIGSSDTRLPVVIVKSVRDLQRIKEVEGIHSILLFDEPEAMECIKGIKILDAEADEFLPGYRKKLLPQEKLNAVLLEKGSFSVDPSMRSSLSSFSSDIRFRSLLKSVIGTTTVPEDFVENVCLYLVGCMTKKSWVSKCQRKGLSSGISVEKMAELEKYIEFTSEPLWRAWYDVNEKGVSTKDASAQFEADLRDLNYLVKVLGKREDLKYTKNPHKTPLIVKKKRKKKLTPSQGATRAEKLRGGPSITTSSVDVDSLRKAQQEVKDMPQDGFSLIEALKEIDSSTVGGSTPYAFSRMASARICGLVKTRAYNAACKQAVLDGASQEDVDAIRDFISNSEESTRLWKAYCRFSYTVGISRAEASSEFDADLSSLEMLIAYKPMAYLFDYAK